jgi:hypothetical protein
VPRCAHGRRDRPSRSRTGLSRDGGGGTAAVRALAEKLIDRVIEFGINGGGPLKGAVPVADEHLLSAGGDREEAVRRLVATHVRLAAVSGFATGIGGIATLPVSVPAATAGLYIIATR